MNEPNTAELPLTPSIGTPGLGFVGEGWIERNRMEEIAKSGLAQIIAVSDASVEAVDKAVESAPVAQRCAIIGELPELDLDGIVIATPSALHAEQAISALQGGKAGFCQKPLARSAAETKLVVDVARSVDRLLGVDLSYWYTEGLQQVRNLLRNGSLGTVYAVEVVFHNAYGPNKLWFYDARLAGGGCLLDLSIHLVDAVLRCLDFPKIQSATGSLPSPGKPWNLWMTGVEDYAAGLVELDSGASFQLAYSWKVFAGCDARIEITFYGTKGGAAFRNPNGSFYDFVAEHLLPDRTPRGLAAPPDSWGDRAAVDWTRRLGPSPRFDPSIEPLVSVAETLDQLYGRTTS